MKRLRAFLLSVDLFLRRFLVRFRGRPLYAATAFVAAIAIGIGIFVVYYAGWALAFDMKRIKEMPLTTTIYDRNGTVFRQVFQENRQWIPSEEIPDVMRHAVVATEDRRFYSHLGVDPISIFRAAVGNILRGRISSGASTITQQLARNSADMSERTMGRKLKEMFLAVRIETVYTKDQILTFYLNRIFWGRDCYGIGAAADAYFGKKPSELTLSEAAMLAGIISGPNTFSPWRSPTKARQAMDRALSRMEERHFITKEDEAKAKAEPLALRPLRQLPASYAAAEAIEEARKILGEETVERGGLKIETAIDAAFQQTAEIEVERQLAEIEAEPGYNHTTRNTFLQHLGEREPSGIPYLEAAFVAIGNADGGILALVGGRNFAESRFDRAIHSRRQVGSTVKPFVYANAFDTLNVSAGTLVDWSPYDLRNAAPGKTPLYGNQPDFVPLRQALAQSNNYASVRVVLASGVDSYAHLLTRATGTPIAALPSSALGACDVTPLRMVSAFSIFPNKGMRIEPYLIRRILAADGLVLYEHQDRREPILSPQIAFQVADMMRAVVDEGTGRGLRTMGLVGDIAGKTGTTNDYRDAWFIGFTSEVTAGVWVGLDKPQPITASGYGSRIALPIWGRVMAAANEHYLPQPFNPPSGLFREGLLSFLGSGDGAWLRDDQRDGYLKRIGDSVAVGNNVASVPESNGNGAGPADSGDDSGFFGWMSRAFGGARKAKAVPAPEILDDDATIPAGVDPAMPDPDKGKVPRAVPVFPIPPEEGAAPTPPGSGR
ncbi:penicillin-binding protein 1A [Verrucomicrobium sp. GAS474]|uniref:transglycosylase domain-containing protein n=1 Tax=Verrucomicrobium sp. GAS474 TaxID=1882831 RepID=UPI00087D72A7|nr:transglycosylase domain-containing protein [Verrucomicrobium sp. GAS474]SDU07645.1 penicillin-binding protein 1A [Verrucomicrobium sp. GAS474]